MLNSSISANGDLIVTPHLASPLGQSITVTVEPYYIQGNNTYGMPWVTVVVPNGTVVGSPVDCGNMSKLTSGQFSTWLNVNQISPTAIDGVQVLILRNTYNNLNKP